MLIHLENEDFNSLINSGVCLVDFYAEWCGPCKMLAPVLESIASSRDNSYKIIKVDVDKHDDLSRKYGIMSVPTMLIMKDGNIEKSMIGYLPEEVIVNELNKLN